MPHEAEIPAGSVILNASPPATAWKNLVFSKDRPCSKFSPASLVFRSCLGFILIFKFPGERL